MDVLCLTGVSVAQWSWSHTSGSCVVIVQGRQAPSHPARPEQSPHGWGVIACHPSITLCLTGHLRDCAQQGQHPRVWVAQGVGLTHHQASLLSPTLHRKNRLRGCEAGRRRSGTAGHDGGRPSENSGGLGKKKGLCFHLLQWTCGALGARQESQRLCVEPHLHSQGGG